jgi:hypothetical protein
MSVMIYFSSVHSFLRRFFKDPLFAADFVVVDQFVLLLNHSDSEDISDFSSSILVNQVQRVSCLPGSCTSFRIIIYLIACV